MIANLLSKKEKANKTSSGEDLYQASQWKLMFWKLRRHKVAIIGGVVLAIFYLMAIFAPIIAPYNGDHRSEFLYLPPQTIHWIDQGTFHPFVYGIEKVRNPDTLALEFTDNKDEINYLQVFVRGDEYKLWGFIPMDFHLFGDQGDKQVFLIGSDHLGRDLFSRTVLAAMVSLSIGLVGVFISFILGVVIGGISGFFGGTVDTIIQQAILFLISMPQIPIWMGLSAAIPGNWPPDENVFCPYGGVIDHWLDGFGAGG